LSNRWSRCNRSSIHKKLKKPGNKRRESIKPGRVQFRGRSASLKRERVFLEKAISVTQMFYLQTQGGEKPTLRDRSAEAASSSTVNLSFLRTTARPKTRGNLKDCHVLVWHQRSHLSGRRRRERSQNLRQQARWTLVRRKGDATEFLVHPHQNSVCLELHGSNENLGILRAPSGWRTENSAVWKKAEGVGEFSRPIDQAVNAEKQKKKEKKPVQMERLLK